MVRTRYGESYRQGRGACAHCSAARRRRSCAADHCMSSACSSAIRRRYIPNCNVRQYGSAHRNRPECTRERVRACMCMCPVSRACVGLRVSESAPSRVIQSMHIYIGRRRNREDGEAACPAAQSRPTCTVPPPERHSQRRVEGARIVRVRPKPHPNRNRGRARECRRAVRCAAAGVAWPVSRSASCRRGHVACSRAARTAARGSRRRGCAPSLRAPATRPGRRARNAPHGRLHSSAAAPGLPCTPTCARSHVQSRFGPRGRCTARALARTKARPCPAKGALERLGASVPEIHPRLGRCARRAPAPARAMCRMQRSRGMLYSAPIAAPCGRRCSSPRGTAPA